MKQRGMRESSCHGFPYSVSLHTGYLLQQYQNHILDIDSDIALLWGKLRVPDAQHALDKLIAATALIYDLTVVTRNVKDFEHTGVRLMNPFID